MMAQEVPDLTVAFQFEQIPETYGWGFFPLTFLCQVNHVNFPMLRSKVNNLFFPDWPGGSTVCAKYGMFDSWIR